MGVRLTVTAKGQVTFRKEVLEHLGAGPGARLEVELLPSRKVQVSAVPPDGVEAFIGCLHSPLTTPPTIDDINSAIADGWAGTP